LFFFSNKSTWFSEIYKIIKKFKIPLITAIYDFRKRTISQEKPWQKRNRKRNRK
jgi:hypothetical protein